MTESRKAGILENLNPEDDKVECNKIEVEKLKHKTIHCSSDDKVIPRSRSNSEIRSSYLPKLAYVDEQHAHKEFDGMKLMDYFQ